MSEQDEPKIKVTSYKISGWQLVPTMKYAEVEAAREKANIAKAELIGIENTYLMARGYAMQVDHESGTVSWKIPDSDNTIYSGNEGRYHSRKDALRYAREKELSEQARAIREVERLKTEHGIE